MHQSGIAVAPCPPHLVLSSHEVCDWAAGFIASHLAKRLKSEGHYIIACDWKKNEHMPVHFPDTSFNPPLCRPVHLAVQVGSKSRLNVVMTVSFQTKNVTKRSLQPHRLEQNL